jgi:hypothetical protein
MADWQPIEIPHSSKVVTGTRVPFWQRPTWFGWDGVLIVAAPVLILGAVAWELVHFRAGHLFDDATIRTTEVGVPLGLLAIAIGIYILYSKFIAHRTVTAACPVCGDCDYWIPGDWSQRCDGCFAYLRVEEDATIREVNLDERSEYEIHDYDMNGLVGSDGSIRITMPAICAVCGAQPSTIVRVKDGGILTDEKFDVGNEIKIVLFYGTKFHQYGGVTYDRNPSYKDPDALARQRQDQLTGLGIPVCSRHTGEVVVSAKSYNFDGRHSSELRFMSYRYYRAFVIVNGLPAKRTAS